MKNILVEKQIISSKIRNYIFRGKNLRYIQQKLTQGHFEKADYEIILAQEFLSDTQSILDSGRMYTKIVSYYKKHKSKSFVRNALVENAFDAELIDPILAEIYSD
jgi:hypothetical protein